MTAAGHGRPFEILRIPDNLLRAPLDYILADHFRQLKVCGFLEDLVAHPTREGTGSRADAIRNFLESDSPLHVADEEEDLFPSLRNRCAEEDGIDEVLDELADNHAADERSAKPVIEGLVRISAGTLARTPRNFGLGALTLTANKRRTWPRCRRKS